MSFACGASVVEVVIICCYLSLMLSRLRLCTRLTVTRCYGSFFIVFEYLVSSVHYGEHSLRLVLRFELSSGALALDALAIVVSPVSRAAPVLRC